MVHQAGPKNPSGGSQFCARCGALLTYTGSWPEGSSVQVWDGGHTAMIVPSSPTCEITREIVDVSVSEREGVPTLSGDLLRQDREEMARRERIGADIGRPGFTVDPVTRTVSDTELP